MPESKRPQIPPQLRRLESWKPEKKATCRTTSGEMWEISAPSKNSLSWSIVLSYVIAMKGENLNHQFELMLGKEQEMKEVMKKKNIGRPTINPTKVRNTIMTFNPFKNRHTFYFDTTMIDVFRIFDLRLNRFTNNVQKKMPWSNSRKLEAASRMLECKIQVHETDKDGKQILHIFPKEESTSRQNSEIVIFQYSGVAITDNIDDVFAFGMSTDHALPLRREALRHILKVAKLSVIDINTILKDFQCDQNFLYFLLKPPYFDVVPILYKSPYIPLKLAEAGFNMDPFCLEHPDGPSVFYYCLNLEADSALITLYDYACNNCYKTDETTRNPGTEIISTLKRVFELIHKDISPTDGRHQLQDKETLMGLQILKFNQYQRDVVESIINLQNSIKDLEHRNQKIICTIFKHYMQHFLFEEPQSENNLTYKNFVQHSWYYENMDSFTCLQFFDIILNLNNSENLMDAMMSLFLTILSYNLFPKCDHYIQSIPCDFSGDYCGLHFVAFNNRRRFHQSAKDLLNDLECTSSNSSGVRKSTKTPEKMKKERVENIRQKLSDFPELKDQISMTRLKVNINSALSVSLETIVIKRVLTIERALQVIGETLCPSPGGKCILSCLLSACIPQDYINQLIQIRNVFSHSKPAFVPGRLHIEQKSSFAELQNFLACLNESFKFVYDTQEFRLILLLIDRSESDARNFSKEVLDKLEKWRSNITSEKNDLYRRSEGKYMLLIDGVLNFVLENSKRDDYKRVGKYGEIAALEFLYDSLPETLRERNQLYDAVKIMKTFNAELTNAKKDELANVLSKQIKVINDSFRLTNLHESFQYNLQSFYDEVKSYSLFSDQEIKDIKEIIKQLLERSSASKKKLLKSIEKKDLTSQEIRALLNDIVMSEKDREYIAGCLSNGDKAKAKLNKVKNENTENMLNMNQNDFLAFLKTPELRKPMSSINIPAPICSKIAKFLNWKAVFLLTRIDHIKEILISDDEEIHQLWKWGRSAAIQKHTRFLMRARYIKERDVRDSLDMLLFDCHNVLPDRGDLKDLWTKMKNLFTGIDLRDVMSHGNTVLQMVGEFLDREDLPTELIDKMLELIEDGDALKELSKLYEKLKSSNVQELENAVDASKNHIQEKIKNCKKWKNYLHLLPLQ